MREIFKSWKWGPSTEPTVSQLEQAQYAIDRWVAVQKVFGTTGWKYIKDDIDNEFIRANSIIGVAPANLAEKQGYCQGLSYVLARIPEYKRAAEVAEEILRLAGPNKE